MRFARHGESGQERPIVSGADGIWRDLSPFAADVTAELLSLSEQDLGLPALPPVENLRRFGAPLAEIGKVVCIGLNYRDHAGETGADLPNGRSCSSRRRIRSWDPTKGADSPRLDENRLGGGARGRDRRAGPLPVIVRGCARLVAG